MIPRLGVKFTLVSGILLVGGAFFLLGFLTYMPPGAVFVVFAIVLRSTEGVGWAMGKTTTLALLPYLYPSHVGLLSGLILGFEGVGYAIGPPIGSLLVSVSDYRVPFWTVGGILLMLIVPAFLLVKTTESLSTEVLPFRTMFKLLSRMSFSMLLLTNVTAYSSLTFMAVSLALYLKEIGLSQVIIGMMFGISAASYVVFAIPFGKLSDLFGTRKFIISGLFGESAALIFLGLTPYIPLPQKWMVASSLVVLGFSVSQIDIPVYSDLLNQAHSLKLVDEDKKDALTSTVSGIASFSMSFGEFLGAIVGGLLTHLMDFPTAAMILGEAAGANAVLVLGVSLIDYTTSRKLVQKT
jgi:MFS family permease